eukprot:scaffold40469_cov72-Cyclotella_meneghiniana.AAC.5
MSADDRCSLKFYGVPHSSFMRKTPKDPSPSLELPRPPTTRATPTVTTQFHIFLLLPPETMEPTGSFTSFYSSTATATNQNFTEIKASLIMELTGNRHS